MGLIDWLSSEDENETAEQSQEGSFQRDQHRMLSKLAENIRSVRGHPLDEKFAVTLGFMATAAALRDVYGYHVIERNCPAEMIVNGLAEGADTKQREHANKLYDDLLADLQKFDGNREMTFIRMAWMLNPSEVKALVRKVRNQRLN